MNALMIIFGLLLLFYSIYLLLTNKDNNYLYYNKLKNGDFTLSLDSNKKYIISIVGGFLESDSGFNIQIFDEYNKENLKVNFYKLNYQFNFGNNKGFDLAYFNSKNNNKYKFKIEGSENLIISNSNLRLLKNNENKEKLFKNILIKSGYSQRKIFIAIICLVFGSLLFIFGLFYNYF